MRLCAEEIRLEWNGTSLLSSARNFLLLHDSLIGGFYRNGKTELGGTLCIVSYETP